MTQSLQAFILGVVQGLTAFLPVSSWSHLIVFPWLLKWNNTFLSSLTFQVALQLGSVLALISFYWKEWLTLIKEFIIGIKERHPYSNFHRKLVLYVIAATIPGSILGYLFEKQVKEVLRNPLNVGIAMIVFGIVLYFADRVARSNTRPYERITLKDSIVIGTAQALALAPGVSRSGITMTAALFLGLDRETSAHFSFLLAMPILLGASLLKLHKLVHNFPASEVRPFIWGIAGSAVVSYIVIGVLLKYLKKHSFVPFVWYRIIFGAFLIMMYFTR
ncbi:MAG: undecaprenyl-diphosphatase UppP [Deltaproteobacteria bacterium]|nr:undecaprenyl-diphosphatase UppP [Deltaproteobacteria bacterium]